MIHIAAAFNPQTLTQSCQRCGAVLVPPEVRTEDVWTWDRAKGYEVRTGTRQKVAERLFPRYSAGALVEMTNHALCLVLENNAQATCHAVSSQAVA